MAYPVQQEDFSSLDGVWDELESQSPTRSIFSGIDWNRLWWEHFGDDKELILLSMKDGERYIGIAPLMLDGGALSFIGDTEVSDYMDFIVLPDHEAPFFSTLMDYLAPMDWRKLELHCLPHNSRTLEILPKVCAEAGHVGTLEVEDVCPTVKLPSTWDEHLVGMSRKDRHELRRKMRRLSGAGDVKYYYVEDDESLPQSLDDFLELHRQSREDKAAFMTPPMERFFKEFSLHFIPKGQERLYFMELDGVRVSANICFDYGPGLYLYNSGYKPDYSHLSVGLLLKAWCLKESIEDGKELFDFLRGDERYKYDLGGQDSPIYRFDATRG